MRYTPEGTPVTHFSVASNRRRNGNNSARRRPDSASPPGVARPRFTMTISRFTTRRIAVYWKMVCVC